ALRRVSGAAHGGALPPQGRSPGALRAHAQRLRCRCRPRAHCRHGDVSAAGRVDRRAGGAAELYGWPEDHRARGVTAAMAEEKREEAFEQRAEHSPSSLVRAVSSERMRILITNDDGIHSDGLDVCADIGRALSDDVWVIAPEFDQSGVSHSLSLNDPLRLRAIGEQRFAVKGTPTDCVIMGAKHVLKERRPNLVPHDAKGIAAASQRRHHQARLRIDQRNDGRGNAYYWIAYVPDRNHRGEGGTDVAALADNRIAVTPLRLDMTDEPFMTKL